MATCYRHPNRETNVSCSSCGRPICPSCMTPTPVGMRCPECAGERTQVRTAASIRAGGATSAISVTVALIALNVLVFLASGQFSFNGGGAGTTVYTHGALYGPLVVQGEDWRLLTYGFLHAGLLHIAMNMFLLWILGQLLEPAIGHVRFAVVYFVALFGGAFGALILSSDVPTVGASGAIFGLMGAAAVELNRRGRSVMEAGIGGLIIINLVFSLVGNNISIGGHIGGLAFGAASMYLFHLSERHRLGEVAAYALNVVLVAVAIGGAIWAAHAQLFGGQLSL